MSKRIAGTALLLALLTTGAHAESPGDAHRTDASPRVIQIGDSGWEFFRPEDRTKTPFDLTYMTSDLWSERAGLGLRFRSSTHLTIDLRVDPLTQPRDLIGPVYDFNIGATVLALRFSF
ncbi:MAG: hypothetical protein OER91_10225 [Gammaproteobacteria bacterium]|nr:hypothetical protein [Gammaproteobacteria bacterium]